MSRPSKTFMHLNCVSWNAYLICRQRILEYHIFSAYMIISPLMDHKTVNTSVSWTMHLDLPFLNFSLLWKDIGYRRQWSNMLLVNFYALCRRCTIVTPYILVAFYHLYSSSHSSFPDIKMDNILFRIPEDSFDTEHVLKGENAVLIDYGTGQTNSLNCSNV